MFQAYKTMRYRQKSGHKFGELLPPFNMKFHYSCVFSDLFEMALFVTETLSLAIDFSMHFGHFIA